MFTIRVVSFNRSVDLMGESNEERSIISISAWSVMNALDAARARCR